MRLLRHDDAVADIARIAAWIGAENPGAARRFAAAVEAAFELLVEFPQVGRVRTFSTGGLRSWGVPGFRNWLIFYRVQTDAVEIFGVFDGRRDLETVVPARERRR
ncbi:MAG: type II toxin-antitoxin system RelE/ParE family toxin [Verrucomicrobia bacterium]|nr:type II toxin-antitoxin system RelE/ParE family toxin [Verrucomicrobiota bacterium]